MSRIDNETPWPTAPVIQATVWRDLFVIGRTYLRRDADGDYEGFDGSCRARKGRHTLTDITEYWPAGKAPAKELTPLEQYEEFKTWIETLPKVTNLKKGDLAACIHGAGEVSVIAVPYSIGPAKNYHLIHREPEPDPDPRTWKVGDLVDSTEGLPDGAIVRDSYAGAYTYNAPDGDFFTPSDEGIRLASLGNPLLIWLPETEEAGE